MPWPMRLGPPPRMTTLRCGGGAGLALGVAAVLDLVGRVHVGGLRLELGAAGVDALEDGADAEALALGADRGLGAGGEGGEAGVGEAELFRRRSACGSRGRPVGAQAGLLVDDLADAGEEPGVVAGDGVDLVVGEAVAHGLGGEAEAVGGLGGEGVDDGGLGVGAVGAGDVDLVEAGEAGLERAEGLLHALVEGAADGHGLADGLHRGGEEGLGAGELLEGEAGDLGDDVVDGRLEGGGGDLGDVVVELVEGVADGELGGDLGDGEAGGLGGQGGGAGDAGVHLDDDEAAGLGVDGELDVGAAGLDADLAQHRDRGVAHHLVFLVGQRQRRGDGDASRRCARPSGRCSRSSRR